MSSIQNTQDIQLEQIGIVSTIVEGQAPITAKAIDGTTRILLTDDPIYLQDIVLTSKNSYIKIILNDDTVFQLGPNSQASLDKYVYDPDALDGEFEAFISSGSFHYISGKISGDNQGQHTLIKTPSAQIGIRGSEITIEIAEDGSTTVLHMSGLITITSNYSLGEILVYERGTSIYIPNENASHTLSQLTEEQVKYHTQEWQTYSYNFNVETSSEPENFGAEKAIEGAEKSGDKEHEDSNGDINEENNIIKYDPHSSTNVYSNDELDQLDAIADERIINQFETETKEFKDRPEPINKIPPPNEGVESKDRSDDTIYPDKQLDKESDKQTDNSNPDENQVDKDDDKIIIAKDDVFDMGNDDIITITILDLLKNDTAPEDISVEIVTVINGTVEIEADNITFIRDSEFSGVDDNGFDYQIGSETAHVNITGNLAPITTTDKVSILESQAIILYADNLLANDFDPNPADILTITGIANVFNGTLQLTAEDAIIFTPINVGDAGFEYTVMDDHGASATGLVQITVNPINSINPINNQPNAVADEFNTLVTEQLTITTAALLENDIDIDGDSLVVIDAEMIENGSISESNGDIIFTPDNVGMAIFEYTIQDSSGATATALVTISVEDTKFLEDVKFAIDDVLDDIPKNITTTIDALLDNDLGSKPITIVAIDKIENGTAVLLKDNKVEFTPDDNFVGEAGFEYTIIDTDRNTDTAMVSFIVENSQPIATSDIISIYDSPIPTSLLLTNDLDRNHDLIEIISVSDNAQLVDSEIIFSSDFSYTISDGDLTDDTTVTVVYNSPPEMTWKTKPLTFIVADEPISIGEVSIIDNDSPNFAEGTLEVTITQNRTINDVLKIANTEFIEITGNTGSDIFYNETKIGSFITDFISGALLISLNEASNASNTEALIQAITYQNTASESQLEPRELQIILTDGDIEIESIINQEIQLVTENIAPVAENDEVEIAFDVYTKISVADLLQNDTDNNPTDILGITEVTPNTEGINVELINNEIQLFVDALISSEPAEFSYILDDGQGGEDQAIVTVNPNNIVTGTAENDNFAGTDELDIILGKQGNDTFQHSPNNDILLGEEGDDTFLLGSNTRGVHIDGGEGSDLISLDGNLNLLQNRNLPDSSQLKLQGIDKIDLVGENNQLYLTVEDVLDISDNDKLIIDGQANDMVNSVGQGWNLTGSDGVYNIYTHNNTQLLVNVEINNQFIS
ncbi:MAG TPA: tandem-95 repeat protein [Thioploca sp.]|nr:tandem-95 repeat protein [Thioploca sp.]